MDNEILDFDSIRDEGLNLVPASKGKRFANFLIDYLVIFVVLFGLTMFELMGAEDDGEIGTNLMDRLIGMLIYASYYLLLEGLWGGKTIGKLVTNTRTVNLDGSAPDFKTILNRSFSRIVPFEAFSFLGSKPDGWHDRWSDTMVINLKESTFVDDLK